MSLPLHIDRVLRLNGISLDEGRSKRLCDYVDQLLQWNREINLVSRRDAERIWESHILHSLSPLFVLKIPVGTALLDLGSGGGLPGIPLAIVHGGLEVTLLDATQKKVRVLQRMIADLGLSGLRAVAGRAEELGKSESLAASFNAVIARAVAPLQDLVVWAGPFLVRKDERRTSMREARSAGKSEFSFPYLLALKGGDLEREIRKVRGRTGGLTITEVNLTFAGSENLELVDKKLVVVEFTNL